MRINATVSVGGEPDLAIFTEITIPASSDAFYVDDEGTHSEFGDNYNYSGCVFPKHLLEWPLNMYPEPRLESAAFWARFASFSGGGSGGSGISIVIANDDWIPQTPLVLRYNMQWQ